jgi:MoaA/NifB/PqqE/SkfB family radical SAM enzyme
MTETKTGYFAMGKESKIIFQVTDECNDGCGFCYALANSGNKTLSIEEHLVILDKIISLGFTNIHWSGGEPMLLPHLGELMEQAKKHDVHNALDTNGILVRSKLCDFIDLVDSVHLSANRGANDKITINAICEIQKFKLPLKVVTVVTKSNKNDLEPLGLNLEKLRVSNWQLQEYTPNKKAPQRQVEKYALEQGEFQKASCEMEKKFQNRISVISRSREYYESGFNVILPNGDITISKV